MPEPTPVKYVSGLSVEDKTRVFCALLKELIALHGGGRGPIPISTPDGEDLGYLVAPPATRAYFDAFGPKLSAEQLAEYERRIATGKRLTPAEARAELIAEVEQLRSREPALSAS